MRIDSIQTTISLTIICAISFLMHAQCDQHPNKVAPNQIITLSNDHITISVCTYSGGRLVHVSLKDSPNMLKVHDEIWNNPHKIPSSPTASDDFVGYNGMIAWLSPQAEWWSQQEILPKKSENKDMWPPDPFVIYGNNTVIHQEENTITLKSPYSEVSGIVMFKTFTIEDSSLIIVTEIVNESDRHLDWGIWTNARFNISTLFFVPEIEEESLWFSYNSDGNKKELTHTLKNGAFSFPLPKATDIKSYDFMSKAFMYSKAGHIVASNNDQMLVMSFNPPKKEEIHPTQGLIEVYLETSPCGDRNLLELEHHSAYRHLEPGKSLKKEQTWLLFPAKELSTMQQLIENYYKLVDNDNITIGKN